MKSKCTIYISVASRTFPRCLKHSDYRKWSSPEMQNLFEDLEDDCPWYYFDGSYKLLLGACLFVFGVFGVLLNGWLFATFIHSHLLIFKSHILVLNLCTASLGRNLVGFPFAGSSAVAKRWLFSSSCCQLFAFLNQFFGVFQMTAIFVAVLERYLLAKKYRHERSLHARYYWLLVGISWFNSVIFATPPLFGYGKFSCDSTGTTCTFLWPSLSSGAKHIGFSIPYILVCGIVPVIAIFYYMGKAVRLERIFYKGEQQKEQTQLTQSIHAVCVATLALWIPAAILIGWQWLPLLIYGYRPHVPPALALIAPIASEVCPTTSAVYYCYDVTEKIDDIIFRQRRVFQFYVLLLVTRDYVLHSLGAYASITPYYSQNGLNDSTGPSKMKKHLRLVLVFRVFIGSILNAPRNVKWLFMLL